MDINKIKSLIDKASIISYDIFDTLLLRTYVNPADLFLHLEKKSGEKGFYIERIDAEKRCREKYGNREDIVFDDIYEEIREQYKYLKTFELKLEERVLHQNWQLKSLYDYALTMHKKVIITSDMYLPKEFLEKILVKNGFPIFDSIFVSGELGKTKSSGSLFKLILSRYSIDPHQLFHIGDNEYCDYKLPKKLGIRSYLYNKISEQYFKKFRYLKEFYISNSGTLEVSILVNLIGEYMLRENGCRNYWIGLGFRCAGPIAYAYSNYIKKEVKKRKITKLLFIARDGYLLKKICNLLGVDIDSFYVYAPRLFNSLYLSECKTSEPTRTNSISYTHDTYNSEKISNHIELPNSENHQYCDMKHDDSYTMKSSCKEFINYISNLFINKKNDKIGIVDTITGEFSAQRLLDCSLKSDYYGLYWTTVSECKYNYNFSTFIPNHDFNIRSSDVFTYNWDFIEFLISSPEFPIKSVCSDGTPVYMDPPEEELKRSEVYNYIAIGAQEFICLLIKIFGRDLLDVKANTIIEYVNSFMRYPNNDDLKNMLEIHFAPDKEHNLFIPLMNVKLRWYNYIVHPKKTRNILRHCIWRSRWQSLFLHILKPLSIKIRSHRIHMAILPYLNFLSHKFDFGRFVFTIGRN